MKNIGFIVMIMLLLSACATQKELSYLNNLDETGGESYFTMEIPDYRIQPRDVLYVSVKAQAPEGSFTEMLTDRSMASTSYMQGEALQYIHGYSVDPDGMVIVPLLGKIKVSGLTVYEVRDLCQTRVDSLFRYAYAEVRLMSFKFTVIGEVKAPGSFINYNDQLTILEAIGFAGGVTETGARERVLVVRPEGNTTKTYTLDLHDKSILSSPAYFLSPNDVVIVQVTPKKVFSLNLPTLSFVVTAITSAMTTTLLLVNFLNK